MTTPGAPGLYDPNNWDHGIDDETLNILGRPGITFPAPLLGIALGLLLSAACGLVGLLILYVSVKIF